MLFEMIGCNDLRYFIFITILQGHLIILQGYNDYNDGDDDADDDDDSHADTDDDDIVVLETKTYY